ncbi:MAG TPA: sugar ABC transporter substrate-binding protein [Patescibacteria group bacterium]|nr:sugar ABC transporter substrate-binding protein [Patescibacteria group bacterium]
MLNPRPSWPIRGGRVVALLAAAALAVTACVPGATAPPSPPPTLAPTPTPAANPYDGVAEGAGAGVKIGYLSYGELVPFVAAISAGIRAQAQLAGVELVECDARLDPTRVDDCMRQLSEAGVQGIIQFQGTLADPAVVCTQVPAGVPVLAVEFAQDPCAKVLVGADDLRAGQIAGRAVGEWVRERWDCTYDAYVSFGSAAAATRSQMRMEGYRQGFSAVCPITNEQIGRAVDTEPLATAAMRDVLVTLPGRSRIIVVAVNGDAARGALVAAREAGREGDVWVSGQGGEEPARELIRTTEQYIGDAAFFPERYGRTVVPAILDLVAGRTVQPLLLIEPAWLDATTIDELYPE